MDTPSDVARGLWSFLGVAVCVACGSSNGNTTDPNETTVPSVGGTASGSSVTGGANATGGWTNAGGFTAPINSGWSSGGTSATGGATIGHESGGATSTGGTSGTGGNPATGGINGTGGTTAKGEVSLIPDPSWTCGMPAGIPSPTKGELVFRATLNLGATHDVGTTQFGRRRILDVKGGTLTGSRVNATILTGGLDLELTLANGAVELEQINVIKASDGTLIYMRNCGVAPAGDPVVRVVADFEVANSKSLAWLNSGKYVGTRSLNAAAGTLELTVYDVSSVAVSEPKVELKDPVGVPNVSWDCLTGTGSKGATVFTENVTLGSSLTVGASKRGSRNIIPITGGTTTGKVTGAVLAGGGDYQLSGLDARYTLAPNDGEFILVRNCGPMGALVPSFEARADGPYAFLNANSFISSDPGVGGGGVSITFYERK